MLALKCTALKCAGTEVCVSEVWALKRSPPESDGGRLDLEPQRRPVAWLGAAACLPACEETVGNCLPGEADKCQQRGQNWCQQVKVSNSTLPQRWSRLTMQRRTTAGKLQVKNSTPPQRRPRPDVKRRARPRARRSQKKVLGI
uniref:Uncharacterized protein n=1 Tax=Globodera rostochiensis TaxID=31243 RepID=A0A914H140_GLORO